MNILNSIVKTITALGIMGALFFSCSINDADKNGTLVINLPGADSARAALSDIKNYRIACGNGTDEVIRVASSEYVSMSLPSGQWAVILTVLDNSDQDIGSSDMETAVIEGGKTTALSIRIYLDEPPLNPTSPLILSGQVYGGVSNKNNPNLAFTHNANVYLEGGNSPNKAPWEIVKGKLTFLVNTPELASFQSEWKKIDNIYTILSESTNVQGAFLNLRAQSEDKNYYTLSKKRAYTYQSTTVIESVRYLYVNQDATVKTSAYELKLKQGWNAIYTKEENNKTIDIRLRNPVLRWTLYKIDN